MPLFKKSKSPTTPRYQARSTENLVPALAAGPDSYSYPNRAYDTPGPNQPPDSALLRTQSQRQPHHQPRPTVSAVAPEDPQPRRLKKNLFVRPSSGILERSISVSVRNKSISNPISQPTSPGLPPLNTEPDRLQNLPDDSPTSASPYDPRPTSIAYQSPNQPHRPHNRTTSRGHPAFANENPEWSQQNQQQNLQTQTPHLARPPIERSNTDPNRLDLYLRTASTDSIPESPHAPDGQQGHPHPRIQQDLVLNARPPSRQALEPRSPVQSQNHPDAMQQASAQAQQPSSDRPTDTPQGASRRGSTAQTQSQNMPEQGRQTPTNARARDDVGDIDVRALIQKHDELQSKYSKVKRYYFEKEAQVQHLQNTVAHQRMAVSRTVLDDNEYANRFQRLDGAIKDLAFSVRKDWRAIPSWLHGLVTDDAVNVGTKEMTAVGRAIISRWLVEEVFQRYFHPGLDPTLSTQLKNIEMNLRRQQMRPATDEDRDNATTRLSNWRRTTFDGLGDTLANPDAQQHREELIEHLTAELASFLGGQLHDPALPGLEGGVRMIVENTINIAEKIPLEARDVCVEYFPPNISYHDTYMKVESQLPPLSRPPPPPADQEADECAGLEGDSSPASNSGGDGTSSAQREPRKKSMFGALAMMGRKPAGNDSNRPVSGPPHDEKGEHADNGPARIRFASFLTVEVRGKGQSMVLAKSPVWLIE